MNNKHLDAIELLEWQEALRSVLKHSGKESATALLSQLQRYAVVDLKLQNQSIVNTPYVNTISVEDTPPYPGDIDCELHIQSLVRWNAMAMVHKTNKADGSLGGHISSYSSSSTLYEVGFNHFFRGYDNNLGDLVYYQGHSSPGIYARSFIEGRLSVEQLQNFRREVDGKGLSSYPHPYLMADYWQFPTVSMGLGPISAIYMARYLKYLNSRKLVEDTGRKVWAFLGDGECGEPESLGALNFASYEHLNNLIFVINCNLQRLDGPVRGNGKIIQDLEAVFIGNGWNVIKVLWGSEWDPLFAKDVNGKLRNKLEQLCDGEFQNCKSKGGAYTRELIFSGDAELESMVSGWSDAQIEKLNRGGHDSKKVYAAYTQASQSQDKPTVILAKTIKGYGLGDGSSSANIAHNVKKLEQESMREFRDSQCTTISDAQLDKIEFVAIKSGSKADKYLHQRREKLLGYLPHSPRTKEALDIPQVDIHSRLLAGTGEKQASTTMGFVNILSLLCKDKNIGQQLVPIVPDEARTFGMEGMFKQVGIYSHIGQLYTPHDAKNMMPYKESKTGQMLEEGINEAGAFASWVAAATSYKHSKKVTIPFYIYYSMFGFQRVGDMAWLAGDSGAKGFLIGATAGRTTLNGEGLQHQDGHSHTQAGFIPNCRSYDPTYNYELAVIIHSGLDVMYKQNKQCFYYITTMNENYPQPAIELNKQLKQQIVRGLYLLKPAKSTKSVVVNLMGSGTILRESEAAAEMLSTDFNIESNVWSMTSSNELYREALEISRNNNLQPDKKPKQSYVQQQLSAHKGPVVIATDYIRNYVEQLRQFIPNQLITLGTDGFGRSDTREQLRHFFEVDRYHIAYNAVLSLYREKVVDLAILQKVQKRYGITSDKIIATKQ